MSMSGDVFVLPSGATANLTPLNGSLHPNPLRNVNEIESDQMEVSNGSFKRRRGPQRLPLLAILAD